MDVEQATAMNNVTMPMHSIERLRQRRRPAAAPRADSNFGEEIRLTDEARRGKSHRADEGRPWHCPDRDPGQVRHSRGARPPMYAIAYRMVAPAITMSMGIRVAQAKPKMVCCSGR